jgi:hypothetical protein
MANVAVAQDPAGNVKPAKDKSIERIDANEARRRMAGAAPSRGQADRGDPGSVQQQHLDATIDLTTGQHAVGRYR